MTAGAAENFKSVYHFQIESISSDSNSNRISKLRRSLNRKTTFWAHMNNMTFSFFILISMLVIILYLPIACLLLFFVSEMTYNVSMGTLNPTIPIPYLYSFEIMLSTMLLKFRLFSFLSQSRNQRADILFMWVSG